MAKYFLLESKKEVKFVISLISKSVDKSTLCREAHYRLDIFIYTIYIGLDIRLVGTYLLIPYPIAELSFPIEK